MSPSNPTTSPVHDVFFCHNSHDKPAVRQLMTAVEGLGLRVWLDENELRPGTLWLPELERVLSKVRSVAIFVGPKGLGPWSEEERLMALAQAVQRGIAVIPVLLAGACAPEDLPGMLNSRTCVDLRFGSDGHGVERLAWGITGTRPARSGVQPIPTPDDIDHEAVVAGLELSSDVAERQHRVERLLYWLRLAPIAGPLRNRLRIPPDTCDEAIANAILALVSQAPLRLAGTLFAADADLRRECKDRELLDRNPMLRIFEIAHPWSQRSPGDDTNHQVKVAIASGMAAESHMAARDRRPADWSRHKPLLLIGKRAVPPGPESGMASVEVVNATVRHLAAREGLEESDDPVTDVRGMLEVQKMLLTFEQDGYYPYYSVVHSEEQCDVLHSALPELAVAILPKMRTVSDAAVMQLVLKLMDRQSTSGTAHADLPYDHTR